MTNFRILPALIIVLIFFNKVSAQLSQSPNISLNKVHWNPAFAGEKGKNRISIQNSFTDYDYRYKYANENQVENNTWRTQFSGYNNISNSLMYDGLSKSTGIGYTLSYGVHLFSESDERWTSDDNLTSRVYKYEAGALSQEYLVNSFGGGLSYKIYATEKEDNNPGTISIGASFYMNTVKITRKEGGRLDERFTDYTDSTNSFDRESSFSQRGEASFVQMHKLNLGLVYNIKKSYIGLNIENIKVGYSHNGVSATVMGGTVISKNVEKPNFSFVPQILLKLGVPYKNNKDYNLTQERTNRSYDNIANSSENELVIVEGFSSAGTNQTHLIYGGQAFVGMINYALNLDFNYKKVVVGVNYTPFGLGWGFCLNFTNFKINYNINSFKDENGDLNNGGINQNNFVHHSLSTNILF